MATYSQFGFGDPLGSSFVRENADGTATQFFWDEASGVITVNEYTNAALGSLIRTLQYNVNNDNVMDYAAIAAYAVQNTDILGDGDDVKTYNGKNDYIERRGGRDVLYAADGHNQVYGGGGHDDLTASQGNDLLFGNNGNETRVAGGTDVKVNVDVQGGGWQSIALLVGDFGGSTVQGMYDSGQLVADHKLFVEA